MEKVDEEFTKYEIARIIGARALQLAMDAPLLLKISEQRLKEINYDALKIAEEELKANVLPITINRPLPKKIKKRIGIVKEEIPSDEELIAKEQEVEKEIVEEAREIGFVNEAEEEEVTEAEPATSEEV